MTVREKSCYIVEVPKKWDTNDYTNISEIYRCSIDMKA